jgi:hypothetical protein
MTDKLFLLQSDALCVEHTAAVSSGGEQWQYFDQETFLRDASVSISCFVEGYLDGKFLLHAAVYIIKEEKSLAAFFCVGKTTSAAGIVIDGKTHYHRHEHYHHYNQQPRAIQFHDDVNVPSYKVRANNKFVEATFVFPNGRNSSVVTPEILPLKRTKVTYLQPIKADEDQDHPATIIEARKKQEDSRVTNRDGFIVNRA